MFSTHLKFTYNYVTVTICVEVSKSTELKSYDSKYSKRIYFMDSLILINEHMKSILFV